MKLRMQYINSLPALPFGSFKIGAEVEFDTSVQANQAELAVMAQALGVPAEHLFIDQANHIFNPFMVAHVIQGYLGYIHTYQYNEACKLPAAMFRLPQLPPPGQR
jgi:hypothetical protein